MNEASQHSCPLCGGNMQQGLTTFSADIDGRLFVARRVPALICEQCGEEWIDNATAQELERLAQTANAARHDVEIVSLAA
jgi:YgiT-type zinc finger domain-containing protein